MRCPFCSGEDTQVKDSRPTEDGTAIRRRRYCPDCGGRFTTFERVQLRELTVVKRLEGLGENEVKSETIGKMVMEALRVLDDVAYVRFASVYKNFREAKDFEELLGELTGETETDR